MDSGYREEGFDPSSLKVAKLRDILSENNVSFPATAKKKHLIELFEKHIVAGKTKSKRKHSRKTKKSEKHDSPSSSTEKPPKAPEKKRNAKQALLDIKSPTKGNVFEVDSDSESDILSPRKKLKISPGSTPSRDSTRDSSIKVDSPSKNSGKNSPTTEEKVQSDNEADVPNASNSSVIHKPVAIPFSPIGSSDSSSSSHEETLTAKSESRQPQSKSPKSPGSSEASQDSTTDSFVDTAHSFDQSLNTLRQRRSGERNVSKEERDVELAKLLGVDIGGVKPKKKGRRVTTPRRPIIIQEKRLSRDYYTLSDIEAEPEATPAQEGVAQTDSKAVSEQKDDLNQEISSEDEETEISATDDEINADNTKKESLVRHTTAKVSSGTVLRGLAYLMVWLSLLGVSLFGYWYREQTFLVGYCGQEIIKPTIPATPDTPKLLVAFGEYLDEEFRPQCVKCPQHARCFPNLEIGCYDDFVEYTPWYFSYMPIVDPTLKKCIPNTKKAEKIEIMIDVALDLLRARNTNRNCGNTPIDDLESGLSIQDLHDLLLSIKAPYITEEEFEELWARSVVELEGKPEIIIGYRDHHRIASGNANDTVGQTQNKDKVFRSTSLSHVSLKCQMTNALMGLVLRFKRVLLLVVVLASAVWAAHWKYQQAQLYTRQVDTLYKEVLSKLQRQAKLAQGSHELPPYVGSIQLRDLILSHESNLARKMRLWEAVSRKVDRNTNVKHQLLEIHGDVMKVWEWISHFEI